MTIHHVEQRSPEWHALRCGQLTASSVADMYATLKSGGEAAGRRNLRVRLALERLTGQSEPNGYQSQAMLDGIEREAAALGAYEAHTGALIQSVGYISHDEIAAGCSPDGVMLPEGVEAKCPTPAVHWSYLESATIPGDYWHQITHTLWITGAQWWDFASYQPTFPEPLRLWVKRVERKDVDLAAHELAVRLFLGEVDALVEQMRAKMKTGVDFRQRPL